MRADMNWIDKGLDVKDKKNSTRRVLEYVRCGSKCTDDSSTPAYHYSNSFCAPRNRSSLAIRKAPRQTAAVKMRMRSRRPQLLTVLRSRRVIQHQIFWTAKQILLSTSSFKDGSYSLLLFHSSYQGTIVYSGI